MRDERGGMRERGEKHVPRAYFRDFVAIITFLLDLHFFYHHLITKNKFFVSHLHLFSK